jgi:hypothetical protein
LPRGLSAVGYDEIRNVAIRFQVAVIATINTPTILAEN